MKITDKNIDKLKSICKKYNVDKIYLFGSAVNTNFSDKSDIDFLVRFKPIELAGYFDNYIKFKEELKTLLKREIDLVEEQTLKNPILINSINRTKQLIYG